MTRDEYLSDLLEERARIENEMADMIREFSQTYGLFVNRIVVIPLDNPIMGEPRHLFDYKVGVDVRLPASFHMPEIPEDE